MNKFNNNKIIITIDGYSSTGKSTIAKALAKKLNYNYIDSGAMYRAITLLAIRNNFFEKKNNYKIIKSIFKNLNLKFKINKITGHKDIFLNGENVENYIRTMNVSEKVSLISTIPYVRKKLLYSQRIMGNNKGIVMDGRDIGSIVFPNAGLKIFLTGSLNVRVNRRYKELINKKQDVTYNKVFKNIIKRDYVDRYRSICPLVKPINAIEIDNTSSNLEIQLENIHCLALKKIKNIINN